MTSAGPRLGVEEGKGRPVYSRFTRLPVCLSGRNNHESRAGFVCNKGSRVRHTHLELDSLVRVLPRPLSTAGPLLRVVGIARQRLDLRLDLRHKRVRRAQQQRCNRARVALERRSLVPLLAPPPPAASLRPVVSSVAAASCTRPARLPAPPLSPPPRLQHGAGAAEWWWGGGRDTAGWEG